MADRGPSPVKLARRTTHGSPKRRVLDSRDAEGRPPLARRWDPLQPGAPVRESCKLNGVFAAFDALGVRAEPVVYADDGVDGGSRAAARPGRRARLGEPDRAGARPLEARPAASGGRGRGRLGQRASGRDPADGDEAGARRHARVSWSTDTRSTARRQLRERLPGRLAARAARPQAAARHGRRRASGRSSGRRVTRCCASQHAAATRPGAATARAIRRALRAVLRGGGLMVEQPFQERLAEGMIRVYLTPRRGRRLRAPVSARAAAAESAGEPPPGRVRAWRQRRALRRGCATGWSRSGCRELQQLLGLDTHVAAGDLGRGLPLRAEDARRRYLRPLRDQRQLDLRVPRARDADGRRSRARAARYVRFAS